MSKCCACGGRQSFQCASHSLKPPYISDPQTDAVFRTTTKNMSKCMRRTPMLSVPFTRIEATLHPSLLLLLLLVLLLLRKLRLERMLNIWKRLGSFEPEPLAQKQQTACRRCPSTHSELVSPHCRLKHGSPCRRAIDANKKTCEIDPVLVPDCTHSTHGGDVADDARGRFCVGTRGGKGFMSIKLQCCM